MKLRTVFGLTAAIAASVIGTAGLAASPAGAGGNGAVNMPAGNLTGYLSTVYDSPVPGVPIFFTPFSEPPVPFPNEKIDPTCLTVAPWLFAPGPDGIPFTLGLDFQTGNAVVYRPLSNDIFGFLPGGLNAIGNATLVDFFDPTVPAYSGPAHVWMGQGSNANGQMYAGETVTFRGTASDGSTISFSVNPGFIQPANSSRMGGWGQATLSCTPPTSG